MESQYPSAAHGATERGELPGSQMVVPQYARYPLSFESSIQSTSPAGSARSRLATSTSPPLHRKDISRSLQSSPRGQRQGVPAPSTSGSGTSMSPPPLFDSVSHPRQARESMGSVDSRSLPSRNISDLTIDDDYVAFILYCNPNVLLSVDTSELRRIFRSPPRSDGKSFSIFTLWELIRKLDKKELKTWVQLAIELGVEPPSLEKKQSTQKVQQYAVRLKRWMRAMHVDAFFEYCLGHPHNYYTQLPPSGGMVSETRDGVPLEEDLALRALVPEWKPKRGRRRAEDKDNDDGRPSKRPLLDTSATALHGVDFSSHSANFPQSAIPFSAFPDDLEATDHWVTASSFPSNGVSDAHSVPQTREFRWRPLDRDASPVAYPQSAILPRSHHSPEVFLSVEPQSAVTPSSRERSRTRRRHGPAVSSAWPGSSSSSTGKARGRPPNKGSALSGPFSSFPANPRHSDGAFIDNSSARSSPAIVAENDARSRFSNPPVQQPQNPFQPLSSRPSKLQLQVPQHPGAPVRLATPPTVLINGVNDTSSPPNPETKNTRGSAAETHTVTESVSRQSGANGSASQTCIKISADSIVRVFSSQLLRGKLIGRSVPLNREEAKALAHATVQKLTAAFVGVDSESSYLLCAMYLGVGHEFGVGCGSPGSVTVKANTRPSGNELRTGVTDADWHYATTYTISYEYRPSPEVVTNVVYSNVLPVDLRKHSQSDVALESRGHSNEGRNTLECSSEDELGEDFNSLASEETWKQRYMKLRKQMRKKELALGQYRRNILQSVMADI